MSDFPVIKSDGRMERSTWYLLDIAGSRPTPRVGLTCHYSHQEERIYIASGANPNSAFSDIQYIDLCESPLQWRSITPNIEIPSRYEHSGILSDKHLVLFGGANMEQRLNDVVFIDLTNGATTSYHQNESDQMGIQDDCNTSSAVPASQTVVDCAMIPDCKDVRSSAKGTTSSITWPLHRTHHVSLAAAAADSPAAGFLYVFSGGAEATNPVNDTNLYQFDIKTKKWSIIKSQGSPPCPRLGHALFVLGNKLFLFGGMSGTSFYDDLYSINLETVTVEHRNLGGNGNGHSTQLPTWTCVKDRRGNNRPSARSGHASATWQNYAFIFGGISMQGALNDLYSYDSECNLWLKIAVTGQAPPKMLDLGMCVYMISEEGSAEHPAVGTTSEAGTANKELAKSGGRYPVCFIFGGMNPLGDIFNFSFVIRPFQ